MVVILFREKVVPLCCTSVGPTNDLPLVLIIKELPPLAEGNEEASFKNPVKPMVQKPAAAKGANLVLLGAGCAPQPAVASGGPA